MCRLIDQVRVPSSALSISASHEKAIWKKSISFRQVGILLMQVNFLAYYQVWGTTTQVLSSASHKKAII
jgi:hypothetical protein